MFIDLLNHENFKKLDCSSIRSGIIAGAPCKIDLCERLVSELGMKDLVQCYGSTETSPVRVLMLSVCERRGWRHVY